MRRNEMNAKSFQTKICTNTTIINVNTQCDNEKNKRTRKKKRNPKIVTTTE